MKSKLLLAILLIFAALGTGCVGTIEDTEIDLTKSIPQDPPPIKFDGIVDAVPVAADKVEVLFFPAPGDSADLVYFINYDGLSTPIAVPGINLSPEYRGYLVYTVTGLSTNTTYNFEVQAKSLKTGGKSLAEAQVSATTLPNTTGNFLGVQDVKTLPGLAGINSIRVSWVEAEKQGSVFVPKEIDPNKYVVTIINGDVLTPGDFHDETKGEPDRKVVFVAPDKISVDVGGLQADTNYHVNVRVIHHGYTLFGSDLNYKKEVNNIYKSVKTLKSGVSNIEFDQDSLLLQLSPGAAGLGSIIASWAEANGAFDHYRIYYTRSGVGPNLTLYVPDFVCDGQETNNTDVFCKKIPFDTVTGTLVDLDHHKDYNVAVAVCQSINCEIAKRVLTNVETILTTPNTANFGGILDIDPARFLDGIDAVYLKVALPDLASGIIDGIIINYYDPTFGEIRLNSPDAAFPNTSNLFVENFNYQTDIEYVVHGIIPVELQPYQTPPISPAQEYCFSAFPFTYDGPNVTEHRDNEVIRCILPTIETPKVDDFDGLEQATVDGNNCNLTWIEPTVGSGIYSHFELYQRDDAIPFGFSAGTAEYDSGPIVDYTRFLLEPSNLAYDDVSKRYSFSVTGLAAGTYRFGILTYVHLGNPGIRRSEYNSNILECVIP